MPDGDSITDLTAEDVMRNDVPSVRPTTPSSKVLAVFAEERSPVVVVTDEEGRYEGFVSERNVLRHPADYDNTQAGDVIPQHANPTMNPEDSLVDVARAINDTNARGVAVVEEEDNVVRVQGVIVREDVIKAAGDREVGDEPVSQFMTAEVKTGDAEDSVAKAISRMKREGFSHLPVVDDGELVGIVTIHDIIRRVIAPMKGHDREGWKSGEKKKPMAVPLEGIMTENVVTLPRGSSYKEAADLIQEKEIGSVVITKEGQFPYGIITRRDMLDPITLYGGQTPDIVIHFSSKDTSREGYESTDAPGEIRSFLNRYQSRLEPAIIQIHAKKHKDRNRRRDMWHIRLNLTSDMGKFYAVGEGWGMAHATRLAVDRLERRVRRAKEEQLETPSREWLQDQLYY
jgi:CBS domain-containing protein/ribosome-associated translation inhibitor RaiA